MRYVIARPVEAPEGTPFWEISDTKRDIPMATVHKDVPHAETVARMILDSLNKGEQPCRN